MIFVASSDESYKADWHLTFDLVFYSDGCAVSYLGCSIRIFHGTSTQAMSSIISHIVGSANDKHVSIAINICGVACVVVSLITRQIGFNVVHKVFSMRRDEEVT